MAGLPFPSDSDTALEAFLADIGFGAPCPEAAPEPSPSHPDTTAAAATDEPVMAGDDQADEERRRRLRRRISNRESARRSRARKQRHLDELRAKGSALRATSRDLVARLRGARARAALVALTNAHLRDEAGKLARRLAAALRVIALRQLYSAAAAGGGFEMQALASLIA
ncbi:hypothetical protein OsI_39249 [Oryza sativa Indica Group]|uniref:BZIP domain-containing protein n=1 Tax=Oryza sativa subsp. indica TaxID=39946 RepID=A2ZN34_ORYSI|nr:hypothetical protein OsI_39249 [Oryza sativa Indica Group]